MRDEKTTERRSLLFSVNDSRANRAIGHSVAGPSPGSLGVELRYLLRLSVMTGVEFDLGLQLGISVALNNAWNEEKSL